MPPLHELTKPEFLEGCLVCNKTVQSSSEDSSTEQSSQKCREVFASQVYSAAADELAAVDGMCSSCRLLVVRWSDIRESLRQVHLTLIKQYKLARRQRSSGVLAVTVHKSVVHIPYTLFLAHSRHDGKTPWSEAAYKLALEAMETARLPQISEGGTSSAVPVQTASVTCQTTPEDWSDPVEQDLSRQSSSRRDVTWVAPPPKAIFRSRHAKSRRKVGPDANSEMRPSTKPAPPQAQTTEMTADVVLQPVDPVPPTQRQELSRLRGWEGITNVQPSAPPRPTQKRVGFEGLREQRARDLEETLSILSIADTASLLDRTETLSVFSDTAELGALADEHMPSLDLSDGKLPDDSVKEIDSGSYPKSRGVTSAPSVSFAEPSVDGASSRRSAADRGEDLLREFAETMSNISEGVVLEDLEGYFEEIDRPSIGRPAPPPSPARATETTSLTSTEPASSCAACRAELASRPDQVLASGRLRCQFCHVKFLHVCKLCEHLRLRHETHSTQPVPLPKKKRRRGLLAPSTDPVTSEKRVDKQSGEADTPNGVSTLSADSAEAPATSAGKLECDECGSQFRRAATLRLHQAVHSGRGYRCTQCEKVFPTKSELQRHADSHRPRKCYSCDQCGKSFQISTSLARHMTLHNGTAVACPICGRCFARKETMIKHQLTHRAPSANTHQCVQCGKMFKERRILAKHIKLMHSNMEMFSCEACTRTFRTRYELLAHARRVHIKRESQNSVDQDANGVMEAVNSIVEH